MLFSNMLENFYLANQSFAADMHEAIRFPFNKKITKLSFFSNLLFNKHTNTHFIIDF